MFETESEIFSTLSDLKETFGRQQQKGMEPFVIYARGSVTDLTVHNEKIDEEEEEEEKAPKRLQPLDPEVVVDC
jgi:hypothetical protein